MGGVTEQALGSEPDTCLGLLTDSPLFLFRKQLIFSSMIHVQQLQPAVFSQRSIHSLEDLGSVSTPPPPKTSGRSSPSKSVLSLYRHSGSVAGSSRQLAAIPESDLQDFPSVNFHWPNWTSSTQKESPLTQKKQISQRFQCPFEIKQQNSSALFDRSWLSICKLAARQMLNI